MAQTAEQASASPAVVLDEIRRLIREDLPRLEALKTPEVGDFTAVRQWLGVSQGKTAPTLVHPRIALFTREGVDTDLVAALAVEANADLKVYELSPEAGGDLSEPEIAHALAYGMMAVQPGVDLAAAATCDDARAEEVLRALRAGAEPFAAMAASGALDIAALAGCIIVARLARVPVLGEGPGAKAAAEALKALNPDAASHVIDADIILARETGALPRGAKSALILPFLKSLVKIA